MNVKILAIDLGASSSVCGVQAVPGGKVVYSTIATTPEAVREVIQETGAELVVVEASWSAFWVADVADSLNVPCVVTSTNDPSWQWRRRRNKSDRTDVAKLIAQARADQLEPVYVPAREVREHRTAIRQRHRLVRKQTRARNAIRSLLAERAIPMPDLKTAWTKAWLEALRKLCLPLEECSAEEIWRGVLGQLLDELLHLAPQITAMEKALARLAELRPEIAMLEEEDCVGPRTAEIVVTTLDDPLRFSSGKKVGCHAGMTPRRWQSGGMEREGRISRLGDPLLRAMLVEVSWQLVGRPGWAQDMYRRICNGSKKRSKIAIVAVARRLLVRLWARWRNWKRDNQGASPHAEVQTT